MHDVRQLSLLTIVKFDKKTKKSKQMLNSCLSTKTRNRFFSVNKVSVNKKISTMIESIWSCFVCIKFNKIVLIKVVLVKWFFTQGSL